MPCESFSSGSQVSFRLRDVLAPGLQRRFEELTPELEVVGEVIFLSDQGTEEKKFAIVSLGGTMSPLIVPIDRLCGIVQVDRRAGTMSREEAQRHY